MKVKRYYNHNSLCNVDPMWVKRRRARSGVRTLAARRLHCASKSPPLHYPASKKKLMKSVYDDNEICGSLRGFAFLKVQVIRAYFVL